jgi:hypothetical protein
MRLPKIEHWWEMPLEGANRAIWPSLRHCGISDPDVRVRGTVLKSIQFEMYVISPRGPYHVDILNFLKGRAKNDPETEIRVMALNKIAEISNLGFSRGELPGVQAFLQENLPFLREQAEKNRNPLVRGQALWAIAAVRADNEALTQVLQ